MDVPHNNGFICSKHKIGYVMKCPSCAAEKIKKNPFFKGYRPISKYFNIR